MVNSIFGNLPISTNWTEIKDPREWDRHLASLNGHPLQSALWGNARYQTDSYESLYLMYKQNDFPVWMARIETRKVPVLGRAAWIPRGPTKASLPIPEAVDNEFRALLRKYDFAMLVSDEYIPATTDAAESDVHTIWIDLEQGLDLLKKRVDNRLLYSVRRASKEGVEVVRATTNDEVSAFFRMCLGISQSKGFELPGSEALMQQLLHAPSVPGEEMHLFLAKLDGKIGAGAFIARSGKHVHYLWGGSDREFSRLRMGETVQWAVIEWATAEGCSRYDLEGIDPVNNPGVYAFKKKMGGEEVALRGKQYYPLDWRGGLMLFAGRMTGRL